MIRIPRKSSARLRRVRVQRTREADIDAIGEVGAAASVQAAGQIVMNANGICVPPSCLAPEASTFSALTLTWSCFSSRQRGLGLGLAIRRGPQPQQSGETAACPRTPAGHPAAPAPTCGCFACYLYQPSHLCHVGHGHRSSWPPSQTCCQAGRDRCCAVALVAAAQHRRPAGLGRPDPHRRALSQHCQRIPEDESGAMAAGSAWAAGTDRTWPLSTRQVSACGNFPDSLSMTSPTSR